MDKSTSWVAIVDDEIMIRRVIMRVLGLAQIPAREFAGGPQFLATLESDPPACVVLDIVMPGMNGLEVLSKIKQFDPHLPVIVMSGNINPSARFPADSGGVDLFLEKPLHAATLVDAVRSALCSNRKEPSVPGNAERSVTCATIS